MAKLQCEICGGGKLLKQGDVWVCQDCGSQYTAEDVRKMFQSAGGTPAPAPEDLPTEVKAPKGETVTVAQAESEAVQVRNSDFTIVAGTLIKYNGADQNVVIPEGVQSIGDECFAELTKLQSVTFPDDVTSIGFGAFKLCSGLKSITFPPALTSIGGCAFYGCTGLSEIILPEGTRTLGSMAFAGCKNLIHVTLGRKTELQQDSFVGCEHITSIAGGSKSAGMLASVIENACTVTVLDGETSIEEKAFYGCKNITSFILPDSITEIDNGAFGFCNLTSFVIPSKVKHIWNNAFIGNEHLTHITIPEGVEVIGKCAFQSCKALTDVVLPKSLTFIDKCAFNGCSGIRKIIIPDGIKSIQDFAFGRCYALTEVVLPDSVTKITDDAFNGCSSLSVLNLPSGLETVGWNSFQGCEMLPKETKKKLKSLCKKAFGSGGCYVATCVYGSYDCPEVWTLRRYRDDTLGATWYGRLFIRFYYAVAPTLVKWFGENEGFRAFWRKRLDRKVAALAEQGVEDTPYEDKDWRK